MPLKTSRELTLETKQTIHKFRSGDLRPISTGIDHLDDCLMGGLLPGTVVGICGLSGQGKSYDMERIQRHILSNSEDDVIYVNCNWELNHFKILLRDITSKTNESIKSILYEGVVEDDKLDEIYEEHSVDNILYQNEPVSADTFFSDIQNIINSNLDKRIVVAIDNLENILQEGGSQKSCMDRLLYMVNVLKNSHPFISFIILNQLNHDYLVRKDDLRKQFPIRSDIYGTGQLYKLCDVLYVKMIPWKLGIKEKFLGFSTSRFEHLQEHKLNSLGKTESFDPYGRAFYFYLKIRENEDDKNPRDLFIEQMFKSDRPASKLIPMSEALQSSRGSEFIDEDDIFRDFPN